MTCATWGRGEGKSGRGREGVCSSSIVAPADSPGLKGAPVKRYPSSYQMAKAGRGREGEGRQQMDELTAVPRRGLIW